MAKKIGVVLSGCGVYDGSEIHEAVITLLAIDRNGAEAVCMAPNIAQLHVVNHLTGEVATGESRNVLVEAARIARGKVRDLATVKAADLDALILPGGFGAAKNLCDFAVKGGDCSVHPEVARLIRDIVAAKKTGRGVNWWGSPGTDHSGTYQSAHMKPSTRLDTTATASFWRRGRANPLHPISCPSTFATTTLPK